MLSSLTVANGGGDVGGGDGGGGGNDDIHPTDGRAKEGGPVAALQCWLTA